MKNLRNLLMILLLVFSFNSYAQKTFCDGWKEGFTQGMIYQDRNAFVTPICPAVVRGKKTYENGFERGFEKATGEKTTVIFNPKDGKNSFCDGWEAGYTNTMNKTRRAGFIVPICPIAKINRDKYVHGFERGKQRALEDMD